MKWLIAILLKLSNYKENKHMTPEQLTKFYEVLDTKNSWGKNEIRKVMLEIIAGVYKS